MKRYLYFACAAAGLLVWAISSTSGFCAGLEFTSETIIRAFERGPVSEPDGLTRGEEKLALPVYEYLGLEYGDPEAGGLSVHMYGWGRKDLSDSDYFADDPEGELLYGYLQYAKPYSSFRLCLGRQHIFSGVTNRSVDGLMVSTGMGPYFSASVFGGLPSSFREENGSGGDRIYGARLAHQLAARYEIGLSYEKLEDDDTVRGEKAGLDLNLFLWDWLSFSGLSSYNPDTSGWREHHYSARLGYRNVQIEPTYQYFHYQDYFDSSDQEGNLFQFLADSDETVAISGADILYQAAGPLKLGIRSRRYDYELRDESADYYAGLLVIDTSGGHQAGLEAGRMEGDTPENIYALYRGYAYWQNPFKAAGSFFSVDALYIAYDAPVYGEDDALHLTMSGGLGFLNDRLEARLSGIYSRDAYFEEDIGAIMTFMIQY